jgi:hypothetical protein
VPVSLPVAGQCGRRRAYPAAGRVALATAGQVCLRAGYQADQPPSTIRFCPVM